MNYLPYLLIGLIPIGVLIYIFHNSILLSIGNYLIIKDRLQPADVIHVVSGPDYRTNYAIQLYKQGYGKEIFFTGGWCKEIQGIHADRGKQLSIEQGIPANVINGDAYQVVSTYQEAERLKLWIDQIHQQVQSVIIVSDPHHMRRAQWAYRQVLGANIKLIMAPVPFDQTPFKQRWWLDTASQDMFREEYTKMIYYYVRYKWSSGPVKEWLASLDTK